MDETATMLGFTNRLICCADSWH